LREVSGNVAPPEVKLSSHVLQEDSQHRHVQFTSLSNGNQPSKVGAERHTDGYRDAASTGVSREPYVSSASAQRDHLWDTGSNCSRDSVVSDDCNQADDRGQRSAQDRLHSRPRTSPTPSDDRLADVVRMLAESQMATALSQQQATMHQQQSTLTSALQAVKEYAGSIAASDDTIEQYFKEFDLVTGSCSDEQKLSILEMRFVNQAKLAFESLSVTERSSYANVRTAMISKMKNDGYGMGQKTYADWTTLFQAGNESEEQFSMRVDEAANRWFRNIQMPLDSQQTLKKQAFIQGLRSDSQRMRLLDKAEKRSYVEVVQKAAAYARDCAGVRAASDMLRAQAQQHVTELNRNSVPQGAERNAGRGQGRGNRLEQMNCSICGKNNHTAETCWQRFAKSAPQQQHGRSGGGFRPGQPVQNANRSTNDARQSRQSNYQQNFQQSNNANDEQRRPTEFGRANAVQPCPVKSEGDPLEYVLSKACKPYNPLFPDDCVSSVVVGSIGFFGGYIPVVEPRLHETSGAPMSGSSIAESVQKQLAATYALQAVRKFDGGNGESIVQFLDEFELFSSACDDKQKLSILQLRFGGQAKMAFDSLSVSVRDSYANVRAAMEHLMKSVDDCRPKTEPRFCQSVQPLLVCESRKDQHTPLIVEPPGGGLFVKGEEGVRRNEQELETCWHPADKLTNRVSTCETAPSKMRSRRRHHKKRSIAVSDVVDLESEQCKQGYGRSEVLPDPNVVTLSRDSRSYADVTRFGCRSTIAAKSKNQLMQVARDNVDPRWSTQNEQGATQMRQVERDDPLSPRGDESLRGATLLPVKCGNLGRAGFAGFPCVPYKGQLAPHLESRRDHGQSRRANGQSSRFVANDRKRFGASHQ
jgi:hypothetical protein